MNPMAKLVQATWGVPVQLAAVLPVLALAGCGGDAVPNGADAALVQAEPKTILRADSVPLLRIGAVDGPDAYLFSDIAGAARLADGRIVAVVRGMHEARMFGADGSHLWSSGRHGSGPGEYKYPRLLGSCSSLASGAVVYDSWNSAVTILDAEDGSVVTSHRTSLFPFGYGVSCAPGGRLALSSFEQANYPSDGVYRWKQSLAYADPPYSGVETFRKGLPGAERFQYFKEGASSPLSGPRPWGRELHFAATEEGAWVGTGDDYVTEFLDWTGAATRRIRWKGPEQEATSEDRDRLRTRIIEGHRILAIPNWRAAAEGYWQEESRFLPNRFPSTSRILASRGGGIWIEQFLRPGKKRNWLYFDENEEWTGTLEVSARWELLDAGADWILVRRMTSDLNVEYLELYALLPVD